MSRNDRIDDPTTVKLLFDVAQSLHDSVDFSSTKQDDNQQAERLIARFIDKVPLLLPILSFGVIANYVL